MVDALALQVANEAANQAMQIVGVSLVVVIVFSIAAFIAVHILKRNMLEGNPAYTKDSALKARAELMRLARNKKVEGERAEEMAHRLAVQQGLETQRAEAKQLAQESARDTLRGAAENAVGFSCPHCQIEMSGDEELVVCPVCGKAQHHVCFDLGGCFNGCALEYVYCHPEGKFSDLKKPN